MTRFYDRTMRWFLETCDPYQAARRPIPKTVWAYLVGNLDAMRWLLTLSLTFAVIVAVIEVWLIGYAGKIIDTLAGTEPANLWAEHGTELIGIALMLLIVRPVVNFVREGLNDIGFKCNSATLYRWQAHAHMTQQSVGWFQQDLAGRTASRLIELGNYTSHAIYSVLHALAFGLVYVVGIVALMSATDPRLALPLLAWGLLYVGLMALIVPRMVTAQETFQNAKSAMIGITVDGFSNFDTLKLFSSRDSIAQDFRQSLENTRIALFATKRLEVSLNTVLSFLDGMILVGFVGYGIYLWSVGAASIGLIGAALALSFRITSMAEWMLDAVWDIFTAVGNIREALKTVGQEVAVPDIPGKPLLRVAGGEIRVTEARHHYGLSQGGLNGVSLTVGAGEKVGLVGPSGAGKSTLVNLILRFHEAEGGVISIDGQDIREVDQDSLRGAIGMVTQQAALLHRSVRDNIQMGCDGASQAEIERAARMAEAHDFIIGLEDSEGRQGYDAHVGERGVKLSGGQRQRIALARVILKDAPILILDEATSALDSEVEAAIQDTLYGLMEGKTVIAIAHRLSTIAHLDRIVVLDQGRVAEMGSHKALLSKGGLYARFWNRQSGGFLATEEAAA